MNYSFINEFTTLPPYIAPTIALGIGTYRVYMNSTSTSFTASAYGINRAYAIHCITDTIFSQIQDRQIGIGTSSLEYSGASTGSNLMIGNTIPAGTILFGDFDHISIAFGLAVIYGI